MRDVDKGVLSTTDQHHLCFFTGKTPQPTRSEQRPAQTCYMCSLTLLPHTTLLRLESWQANFKGCRFRNKQPLPMTAIQCRGIPSSKVKHATALQGKPLISSDRRPSQLPVGVLALHRAPVLHGRVRSRCRKGAEPRIHDRDFDVLVPTCEDFEASACNQRACKKPKRWAWEAKGQHESGAEGDDFAFKSPNLSTHCPIGSQPLNQINQPSQQAIKQASRQANNKNKSTNQ